MAKIYALVDSRTWLAFYVGMTENEEQRFSQHKQCSHNEKNRRIIAELDTQGLDLRMVILEETEDVDREKEAYWTQFYFALGMPLTNVIARDTEEQLKILRNQAVLKDCLYCGSPEYDICAVCGQPVCRNHYKRQARANGIQYGFQTVCPCYDPSVITPDDHRKESDTQAFNLLLDNPLRGTRLEFSPFLGKWSEYNLKIKVRNADGKRRIDLPDNAVYIPMPQLKREKCRLKGILLEPKKIHRSNYFYYSA